MRISILQAALVSFLAHVVVVLFVLKVGQMSEKVQKVRYEISKVDLISISYHDAFLSSAPILRHNFTDVLFEKPLEINDRLNGHPNADLFKSYKVNFKRMSPQISTILEAQKPPELGFIFNNDRVNYPLIDLNYEISEKLSKSGNHSLINYSKSGIFGVVETKSSDLFRKPQKLSIGANTNLKETNTNLTTFFQQNEGLVKPDRNDQIGIKSSKRVTSEGKLKKLNSSHAELKEWSILLQREIRNKLRYPLSARIERLQGVVLVKVKISRLGEIQKVRLLVSSGHSTLDQAAIAAVLTTANIPKAPRPLNKKFYTFRLPIRFEI